MLDSGPDWVYPISFLVSLVVIYFFCGVSEHYDEKHRARYAQWRKDFLFTKEYKYIRDIDNIAKNYAAEIYNFINYSEIDFPKLFSTMQYVEETKLNIPPITVEYHSGASYSGVGTNTEITYRPYVTISIPACHTLYNEIYEQADEKHRWKGHTVLQPDTTGRSKCIYKDFSVSFIRSKFKLVIFIECGYMKPQKYLHACVRRAIGAIVNYQDHKSIEKQYPDLVKNMRISKADSSDNGRPKVPGANRHPGSKHLGPGYGSSRSGRQTGTRK